MSQSVTANIDAVAVVIPNAPCVGRGKVMFPTREEGTWLIDAKAVCRQCHGRQECLDRAIANAEPHGIWGGMSTSERFIEAKRRRREARVSA